MMMLSDTITITEHVAASKYQSLYQKEPVLMSIVVASNGDVTKRGTSAIVFRFHQNYIMQKVNCWFIYHS